MLTDKVIKTVILADGAWVKIRKPGIGIKAEARNAPDDMAWLVYLNKCITEWSYEEGLSAEAIGNLDDDDALLILNAITGTETEADTKNA